MDLQSYGLTETEIEFLEKKEREGNLVWQISSEFTNNADQITITPPSGKTFHLLAIKLYPVVDTIVTGAGAPTTFNRRADVELTYDGVVQDVVTHDMEATQGSNVTGASYAQGAGGQTGQYTGLARLISMAGDGIKSIKMTSTNTSGTYRCAIFGYYRVT